MYGEMHMWALIIISCDAARNTDREGEEVEG